MACKIEDTCKLELCCFDLESVALAAELAVPAIELCVDYPQGGLWPGEAMIREARRMYAGCLNVMVRPRPGDFDYDEAEREEMSRQIDLALAEGADGLTFGMVGTDGSFPIRELIALCDQVPEDKLLTFHRAFDLMEEPGKALGPLGRMGFRRVLSSGGAERAVDQAGQLKLYRQWAGSRLTIVAAGGVRPDDIPVLQGVGIRAYHSAASILTNGRADRAIIEGLMNRLGIPIGFWEEE